MALARRPYPRVISAMLSSRLIYPTLFLAAFIPRMLALDVYVAPDEGKWIYRSAHFLQAFLAGNLAQMTSVAATPDVEVLAPAVPTMWAGALGLTAKYWFDNNSGPATLPEYLGTISAKTEKISLDVYPWTRFPTVLLTSLAIPAFYFLLSKLVGPGATLLAGLLLAFDPFFIGLSRVIHHDALVSIFMVFSVLALLTYKSKAEAKSSRIWLIVSAVAGGLALLTKPTTLYLFVFVGLFLLFEPGLPRRSADWRRILSESLTWAVVVLLIFVVLWPALWVAPLGTLNRLLARSASAIGEDNSYALLPFLDTPLPELGFLFYPVNWLFKTTPSVLIGLTALMIGFWRGWFSESAKQRTSQAAGQPDKDFAIQSQRPPIGNSPFRAKGPLWAIHNSQFTIKWLAFFSFLFLLLIIPANTRDIRYFLPAALILQILAAIGIFTLKFHASERSLPLGRFTFIACLILLQLLLTFIYAPYFVDYLNPLAGGPWLGPRLIKIGSGEGLDQMGRYLDQKPQAAKLTVATSFWESFVPFFSGRYTKPHYDEEADYLLIYLRQIQNNNPFPEYWTYFSARPPEYKVSLVGLDYVWLYPGPQLRVVSEADFANGVRLRGYRLDRPAAQSGQIALLTLVWAGAEVVPANQPVTVRLFDPSGQLWAEAVGPLLDPAGPSAVEGHYPLELPADIPRGDYPFEVSLSSVSHSIGLLPVRQLDQPAARLPLSANFGDLLLLGGAEVSETALPGTFEIKLVWQAQQPMSLSYTTFVHAVDESGALWGQVDRIPHLADHELPTHQWQPGEWVVDTFQLSLKPNSPPGPYRLLVGWYNGQTLERLPLIGADETVVEITSITMP